MGCCWALMLTMFVVGVGSLWWMVVLTAVMVIQKTHPRGARLIAPVGVILLAVGIWVGLSELLAASTGEIAATPHQH